MSFSKEAGLSIGRLFIDAKNGGGLQYLFTLLRAEGITSGAPDTIRCFYFFVQKTKQELIDKKIDAPGSIFKI